VCCAHQYELVCSSKLPVCALKFAHPLLPPPPSPFRSRFTALPCYRLPLLIHLSFFNGVITWPGPVNHRVSRGYTWNKDKKVLVTRIDEVTRVSHCTSTVSTILQSSHTMAMTTPMALRLSPARGGFLDPHCLLNIANVAWLQRREP